MTPKLYVKRANPNARLDYYETLRNAGKPCWFIRDGFQGGSYTDLFNSPRRAWKAAYDSLLAAIRKGRRGKAVQA